MKDFASFNGSDNGTGEEQKSAEDWMKEAQTLSSQFNGKSEGDLMRAIYARALEGKRNGTLTNEQIDAFVAQISPMLDGVKRKKLHKVVQQLKNM